MRISLRLRFTFWFLAFFATVYIAVIAIAMIVYRGGMRRSLDSHMIVLAQSVGDTLLKSRRTFSSRPISHFQPVDRRYSLIAVRSVGGRILAYHEGADTLALPPLAESLETAVFHDINKDDAGRLTGRRVPTRLITYRVAGARGTPYYIDVIRTASLAEEERSFLSNAVVIGAIGALLAFWLVAWQLAGRAVWPLERLTAAARALGRPGTELVTDASGKEVERLQAELNEALKRREDGYKERERFIDNVAHDLKTPLSVLLAQSQVLRPNTATREDLESYRRSVVEELWRLAHLVHGMLALARGEGADVLARRETVSVNDVIMECVAMCRGHAEASGIVLAPELIDPERTGVVAELEGDPDQLRAMLANILHNAIRYSPKRGTVDIRAEMSDGEIRVHIRDRGPGIPEAYLERIFDRFVQVPSDGRPKGGSGIGLAIARAVVTSHGGWIQARNCADGGCEFTIGLPLTSPAPRLQVES